MCRPVCPDEVDVGHTDNQVLSLSASYSPTDRISINASLPYGADAAIADPDSGGHDHEIDDGTWHSTITDLQLTVNYQLVTGAFGLAPYVGAVIPTHDYTTFGHSAPGRGLNEYWVGAYAAMSLNEWIPRTYVQLRGNYAFVEEVAGYRARSHQCGPGNRLLPDPGLERARDGFGAVDGWRHQRAGPAGRPAVPASRPAGGGRIRCRRRGRHLDRQRARQRLRLLHAGDRGHERPQGRSPRFDRRELRLRRHH